MADRLHIVIRTPHEVVLDTTARSLRVGTETGQVGLRPGMEPIVLAVEAGLVVIRSSEGVRFVGSAGGLLSSDGHEAILFTPLAVSGHDRGTIKAALAQALAEPDSELTLRSALDKLEGRILSELRRQPSEAPPGSREAT